MLNKLFGMSKLNGRVFLGIIGVILLYFISYTNFALFHFIIEIICIIIGFSIYIITKNTHKVSQNNYFIFLGVCFIVISIFDLLHVMTYDSIRIFSWSSQNLSVQFRTAASVIQSIAFLIFSILLYRRERPVKIIYLVSCIFIFSTVIFLCIYFNIVPIFFENGRGSTLFKKIIELIICLTYADCIKLLNSKKVRGYENIAILLAWAAAIFILSELSYTLYTGPSDLINITGHIFKLLAYHLIYKAIIKTTLENPYNVLFYRLTEINSSLEIKTRQLMKFNKKLNDEIQERKIIEEKLINSKKNYQELLDFLPYAIVAHSDGKIVYVNNATLRLFKFNEYKDVLYKEILEFVPEKYCELVKTRMNAVYRREILDTVEMQLLKSSGELIDVETKAVPYMYKNKLASLVIIGDISQRKKAEEKEKALKEAIEYDRIKNEFMANISHELRTPLNVIFGAVQLIDYYSDNNSLCDNKRSISKYSKSMKQNCYRMLRLVNNLIDLTKIDSGFLKLNLQNYNIISVIEDITMSVAEYIESKHIDIEFDTEIEEKYIACDADMIERIVLNLLSNAVKFTPEGGKIWVNVYDKNDYVILSVRDSGIGIPEDKKELIFDRFRQVDKSFARNTEGSGIGLNLVKSIVELHGGKVWVESKYGKGSEFFVKIPVITVPCDEIAVTMDIPQGKVERIHIEFSDIYS
ncbi:PAS domain S-box protein [Clostridium sp. YIM B02515]|uniref:histidine kinase n=1 Tax=Clostridium rhizosphaerae TaxID=2803861 RepID=A0ABS1TAL3_9CLOT|nr:MASE3 domain-containing protein [Clostridium rhizosphaerae]MBL4936388.1 PAS domain S-box protein [Clostridium rhizosphaerae]